MDRELLVLSDNFGTTFSGGCTATANFVKHWKHAFKAIHVVCKQTDNFLKDDVKVWNYSDQESLNNILSTLAKKEIIGYGDFYTAVNFIHFDIPFYFTYHDNYPELKELDPHSPETNSMFETYAKVFKNANFVFSVSEYKLNYIRNYTNRCSLVRNGISQPRTKTKPHIVNGNGPFKILMAGNFSVRKYEKALLLFDQIKKEEVKNIQIDVFGHSIDEAITQRLEDYTFVQKQAFRDVISYSGYHIYLNTSLVENLSLSVVDAIANHTPVVSFDVGGIGEVIDGSNGVIIPKYDTSAMLSAILQIKSGRTFDFEESKIREFDWALSAEKMLRIINESMVTA